MLACPEKLEKVQEQFRLVSVPLPGLQGTLILHNLWSIFYNGRYIELTRVIVSGITLRDNKRNSQYSWIITTGCDHFTAAVPSKRKLQTLRTCMGWILTPNGHINFATRSNVRNLKSASNGLINIKTCFIVEARKKNGLPFSPSPSLPRWSSFCKSMSLH